MRLLLHFYIPGRAGGCHGGTCNPYNEKDAAEPATRLVRTSAASCSQRMDWVIQRVVCTARDRVANAQSIKVVKAYVAPDWQYRSSHNGGNSDGQIRLFTYYFITSARSIIVFAMWDGFGHLNIQRPGQLIMDYRILKSIISSCWDGMEGRRCGLKAQPDKLTRQDLYGASL
jgi:hypothetical protein